MKKLPAVSMDQGATNAKEVPSQTPYARVGEEGVEYNGPHSSKPAEGTAKVIVFGKQARALLVKPEMSSVMNDLGKRWQLLPVASDQNWGAASTQLVHALMDEHAMAVIALDRDAAHLAEQLALKAFVPVIALSDDKKLTSTNVPWIFRLPGATSPVDALRLVQSAAGKNAATPEQLRDVLASGASINGIAFLSTGEPKSQR